MPSTLVRVSVRLLLIATMGVAAARCGTAPAPASSSSSTSSTSSASSTPPTSSAAAAPQAVQPGAPGQPSTSANGAHAAAPAHTSADTTFMQGMIHHHAQAVEMVDLLQTRTTRPDMKLLGERIRISQTDEIKMMKSWLTDHHETVPAEPMAHGAGMKMDMPGMTDMPMMPGMLTHEQMAALEQANGTAFDRLFLEGMIQHHSGALTMVQDLFSAPGAGQDSVIFDFATHVDADQRMEISRMRQLLKDLK